MQIKLICTRKVVHFWNAEVAYFMKGYHKTLESLPIILRVLETTGHELALRYVHTIADSFSYQHKKASGIV